MKTLESKTIDVGVFYSVPCAVVHDMEDKNNIIYVPIIPIKHKDKQFGALGQHFHYHIDGRFIRQTHIAGVLMNGGLTNQVLLAEEADNEKHKLKFVFRGIVNRRRKCVRLETGLDFDEDYSPETWSAWYKTMIGKKIVDNKCPHYGATMIEKDGVLKCPLHNLEGCPKNLEIIRPKSTTI